MPAEVLFEPVWAPGPVEASGRAPVRQPARSFRVAIAVVLAALSAIALAVAGGTRVQPIGNPLAHVDLPPPAITVAAVATTEPEAPAPTPARLHREDDRDIEALATAVARRYRVSDEAIHDVVRTAFHEARRNSLDPLLVVALIAIESRFNPFAQSPMGALGLMQVIPQYHVDKFDPDDESVLDPRTNIRVGTRVLREYIARGGNEAAGLQLYNGSSDDNAAAYIQKVAAEKQRLQAGMRRARSQAAPLA